MDSGWGSRPNDWQDAHPIGRSFERFLFEHSDFAVYLRLRDDDPCEKHWSYSGGADASVVEGPPCPVCWGTGKRIQAFITPIRTIQGNAGQASDLRMPTGYVLNWEIAAYLPRCVKPSLQDLVLLVEWNVPTSEVPYNQMRRAVTLTDATQIESINERHEREMAFTAVTLKSYGVDDTLYQRDLPLMVGLPLLSDYEWPRLARW